MPWALLIYKNLTDHDYDVFFDYESIGSGDFEQIILGNIRARAHFIVLLTPSALDRCDNPDDWLRREIETALVEKRNIVPIFLKGFDFASHDVSKHLTGELAKFAQYNGLNVPDGYFEAAMENLREKFLAASLDTVLHPLSASVQEAVVKQQTAATNAVTANVSVGQARIKIIVNPSDPKISSSELSTNRLHTVILDGIQTPFNFSEFVKGIAKWQVEIFNDILDAGQHEIIIGQSSTTVERVRQKFSVSNGQTATATIYPFKTNDPNFPTSMFKVIRWKISIRIEPKLVE